MVSHAGLPGIEVLFNPGGREWEAGYIKQPPGVMVQKQAERLSLL